MNNRPRPVTLVGWLFIVVGVVSFLAHLLPLVSPGLFARPGTPQEHRLALVSGILAGVGGVFVLRGRDWARWLCIAWMGLHVIISFLHPLSELLTHIVLFASVLYLLLRRSSTAYFRHAAPRSV